MKPEDFSESEVTIKLGDKSYLVRFGILARRRIHEAHPDFSILGDKMPDFEIIPFLIRCGIEPSQHGWKSEEEFIELYDACKDENLQLIPVAYQNAMGFTNQQFAPLINRLTAIMDQPTPETTTKKVTKGNPNRK